MDSLSGVGKALMGMGALLIVVGSVLTFGPRLLGLGRLPGDIVVQKGNFTFYFPLMTSIVVSLALSLLFLVIGMLRR